jgi:hypothetical protein
MNFRQWFFIEAQLPEPVFMGWEDFLYELNKSINRHVHKTPEEELENGLRYVVLYNGSETATKDSAELEVSLGKYDWPSYPDGTEEKRLAAVKYFITSMEMKIDKITKSSHPSTPNDLILHVSGLQRYETPSYSQVQKNNPYMYQALATGRMIDVRQIGVEINPKLFRLNKFIPDVEYVDSENGQYIWSIGRDKATGEIFAAFDQRFYGNPDYECVFLR